MANTQDLLGFLGKLFIAQKLVRASFPTQDAKLVSAIGTTESGQPTRSPKDITKLTATFKLRGWIPGKVIVETLPSGQWGPPRYYAELVPEPSLPLLIDIISLKEAFKRLDQQEPNAQVKRVLLTTYPLGPTPAPFYNFTIVKGGGEEDVRIFAGRGVWTPDWNLKTLARRTKNDLENQQIILSFEGRVAIGVRKVEEKFASHNPVLYVVVATTANGQPAKNADDVDIIELLFAADGASARIIIQCKNWDEWGEPVLTEPGVVGDAKLNEPLSKTLEQAYAQLAQQTQSGFLKVVISAPLAYQYLPISIANYTFSLPDGKVIVIPVLDGEVGIDE